MSNDQQRQSVYKRYPAIVDELRRLFVEENEDSFAAIADQLTGWLRAEEGTEESISVESVRGKIIHMARSDAAVLNRWATVRTKHKLQRESDDLWDVPRLLDRLTELVRTGALVDGSEAAVFAKLKRELGNTVSDAGFRLTKKAVSRKINEIIWTKERLRALEDIVQRGMDLSVFAEHNTFIPESFIKSKAREYTGVSRVRDVAAFKPGVNRISMDDVDIDPDFVLPETRLDDPFVLDVSVEDGDGVTIINGPNIGVPHSRDIRRNSPRRSLVTAESHGDKVVLITGGLLDVDLKQAGKLKAYRDLVSGYNTNPDVLDPDYREKALSILEGDDPDAVLYETLNERFLNLLAGWAKIALKPNGIPEFSGRVYIQLGYKEEELAMAMAYAEARYRTICANDELDVERRIIKDALATARKEENAEEIKRLERHLEIVEKEKQRTIVSNISPETNERLYLRALAYLCTKIEETIPNSRVIGMGTAYVQVDDDVWELRQVSRPTVTDSPLDLYLKRTAGAQNLAGTLPDVVVLCHPWSVNYRWSVVERQDEGERESTQVFQPPCAMDGEILIQKIKKHIRKTHHVQRQMAFAQAETGLLRLVYSNGIWNAEVWTTPALPEKPKKRKCSEPYLWLFVNTDIHVGHPWREIAWHEPSQRFLTLGQAVREMMRQDGLLESGRTPPIHAFFMLDDGIQGHNFGSQKQPHQQHVPYYEAERRSRAILDEYGPEAQRQYLLNQLWRRGEHWPGEQLKMFLEHEIRAQVDFYSALLLRVRKAGVQVRGVSYYRQEESDRRDIGAVNFGSGNHLANTVDKELAEGPLYAETLIAALSGQRRWEGYEELLRRWVRAPLYGNTSIGWGTLGLDGGYEWPILLRGAPSRKNPHGDTSRREVKTIIRRGDFPRFIKERRSVHLAGDIHRFHAVMTPFGCVLACASETDTDPFGELGFTPNNTGLMFVGLPVGGPDAGPTRIVTLRWDFVRKWIRNPRSIDWETLLPSAA